MICGGRAKLRGVIGDVDARRQGEPDSDELRDDDIGDFDGHAGWGQAGTWLRRGNQRAGEVTDCHDHQWDPVAVVRAQPPAGPTPGRTGLQLIVTDDLAGSEGDLARSSWNRRRSAGPSAARNPRPAESGPLRFDSSLQAWLVAITRPSPAATSSPTGASSMSYPSSGAERSPGRWGGSACNTLLRS